MAQLDRAEFQTWLEGKKPRQIVGQQCSNASCPLAMFVQEACELVQARIGFARWYPNGQGHSDFTSGGEALPAWAQAFVADVDRMGAPPNVTAQRALRILAAISEDA